MARFPRSRLPADRERPPARVLPTAPGCGRGQRISSSIPNARSAISIDSHWWKILAHAAHAGGRRAAAAPHPGRRYDPRGRPDPRRDRRKQVRPPAHRGRRHHRLQRRRRRRRARRRGVGERAARPTVSCRHPRSSSSSVASAATGFIAGCKDPAINYREWIAPYPELRDKMMRRIDRMHVIICGGYAKLIEKARAAGDFDVPQSRVVGVKLHRPDEYLVVMTRVLGLDPTDTASLTDAYAQGLRADPDPGELLQEIRARFRAVAPAGDRPDARRARKPPHHGRLFAQRRGPRSPAASSTMPSAWAVPHRHPPSRRYLGRFAQRPHLHDSVPQPDRARRGRPAHGRQMHFRDARGHRFDSRHSDLPGPGPGRRHRSRRSPSRRHLRSRSPHRASSRTRSPPKAPSSAAPSASPNLQAIEEVGQLPFDEPPTTGDKDPVTSGEGSWVRK